jgi:hypothetical protein
MRTGDRHPFDTYRHRIHRARGSNCPLPEDGTHHANIAVIVASPTPLRHRVSFVESAMAELARTLQALELRRAEEREEEAKRREEETKRREEEAKRREEEAKQRHEEKKRRDEEWRAEKLELDREWNRQRGEIANKMGTLVEDMVAPSIPRVVASVFGIPGDAIEHLGPRVLRRHGGATCELDVVTAWAGHWMVTSVKTRLRPEDVPSLIRTLHRVRAFFPEYADRKLVGAVASLYLDPSVIEHAERQGLIVIGLGDHLMEAKCSPGFAPRIF